MCVRCYNKPIPVIGVEQPPSLDPAFVADVAVVIRTMGHPDRLRIVELLCASEMCVSEVQEAVGLTQGATSQHLRQMYHQGILSSRRDGRRVLYAVHNPLIGKMLTCLGETQREMMEGA
jgi:DNA-binding transcriptional ArsR family regulator